MAKRILNYLHRLWHGPSELRYRINRLLAMYIPCKLFGHAPFGKVPWYFTSYQCRRCANTVITRHGMRQYEKLYGRY